MVFLIFISFLIALRIGELLLARRNEKWLVKHGATEYGRAHYPFMVALHTAFIVSLVVEYALAGTGTYSLFLLALYFVILGFKVWVVTSLGRFWNTKIYRVPDFPLVKKGPYRYLKHPNYMIVVAEIAIIPLIFHLYYTAVIFTLLNGAILYVRIAEEDRALEI